jgi:D-xylose transport system substrate-binding protein
MAEVLAPEIDALDAETPAVFMLNGGEEDNNAFLFKDGYNATVQEKVDAGEWSLAGDQFVPGWGANGEGQGIMEQALTDANNEIDAVFAANDNLAQQAINAIEAAGVDVTGVPISGQDATAAGIQNIALGKQTMTVYKPIQAEADVAAKAALALCAGDDPSAIESEFEFETIGIQAEDGKPTDTAEGEGVVPYLALTPTGVTVDNIADTVIADDFRTVEEICTGEVADTEWCQENG